MPYRLPDQDTRTTPEYGAYKKVLYQYLVCGIHSLNTGLKTQNVEELSLDLIFHDNFW